jgi:DNA (cytosine-5)-methyltransferase 1
VTGEHHLVGLPRLSALTERAEYDVHVLRVNAADFGAPQKRHRVVIVGFRTDQEVVVSPFGPSHSRRRLLWDQWVDGSYWKRHGLVAPPVPVADASAVQRLRQAGLAPSEKPWATLRDAVADLGEPDGRSNHVFQPGARSYPGHTGSPLDQPAKALKAGVHGVPGGENMMVRDDGTVRYFTVREAARLQGLPDEYTFPRSWSESLRQLGNAVPAQLGEAVGQWVAETLRSAGQDRLAA